MTVINKGQSTVCKPEAAQTPPIVKTKCADFVYGNTVKITSIKTDPSALKICNVEIYGRKFSCKYEYCFFLTEEY